MDGRTEAWRNRKTEGRKDLRTDVWKFTHVSDKTFALRALGPLPKNCLKFSFLGSGLEGAND